MVKQKNLKIKVIIADTSFSSRKGLNMLIHENKRFKYIAEAADNKVLIAILEKKVCDVLIIHYCCNNCFPLEVIKRIKIQNPDLKILVISHMKPPEEIEKVIDIGIKNYLFQDFSEKEITQGIEACSKGTTFFPKQIINVLLKERDRSKENFGAKLSKREDEILRLIAQGATGKEIAERLSISHHTVHTHRKNISKKLHIKSTAELVLYAIRSGLISLDENFTPYNDS